MSKLLIQVWGLLTAPLLSLYGLKLLKKCAIKSEPEKWSRDFKGKRVLIVGTGPSLARVADDFLASYDACVFINYAIMYSDKVERAYFFSTDIGVVQRLLKSDCGKNVRRVGSERCLVAPIFLQQMCGLTKEFKSVFSWLRPSAVRWQVKLLRLPFIPWSVRVVPSLPVCAPRDISLLELEEWNNTASQLDYFPVCASTSALSAIIFCAKYRPSRIDMIGCDFSAGRVPSLKAEIGVASDKSFNGAVDKFNLLRDYLKRNGVCVENKSWVF